MKSLTSLMLIGLFVALTGSTSQAYAGDAHGGMERDARVRHADWVRTSEPSDRRTEQQANARDESHQRESHNIEHRAASSGMQPVLTTAAPGQPGYGWRYFSDPVSAIAVVISPQGEHYFSRGDGLRPIAVSEPAR